jgi:hypothetical protein
MLVLLGMLWGFSPAGALAHKGKVVRATVVEVGPYTMDVLFYATAEVGQPIPVTIAPRPVTSKGQVLDTRPQLQATLQPSPGMTVKEIRLRVYDDPDQPSFYAVDPVVDEAGVWVLQLAADGEAGSGTGSTKVTVAAAGGSAQAPSNAPRAPVAAPTPTPAAPGLNMAVVVPLAVGVALLLAGGLWLLRRPPPAKKAPARRRK